MRQANGYILKRICDVPYILPYGQNIADFRHGVRINETGVFLWNNLAVPISKDELFLRFVKHFDASEAELTVLSKDFSAFLSTLTSLGMIDMTENLWLSIGGLILCITGDPALLSNDFRAFQTDPLPDQQADLAITLSLSKNMPSAWHSSSVVLSTSELILRETDASYLFDFLTMTELTGGILSKDGKTATLYYLPLHTALQTEQIFHALRFLFLYRAEHSGIFAIHSASILYRGKAWLFSGSSGTGKSTHTALWRKLYDTPVLNGDLNLITISAGKPMVYGLPWCGTSGISSTETYPLGGIIFLRQWQKDHVTALSPDEQALHILHRLISPIWDEAQLTQCLAFSERLSALCYVTEFFCTKNDSAAQMIKLAIDKQLNK